MPDGYKAEELARMQELTDYQRSYEAIASAMTVAANEECDPKKRPGMVVRHLLRNRGSIDALAAESVFLGLVGFMAHVSGESPRTIYEAYFKSAPSDDWWRERLEGAG